MSGIYTCIVTYLYAINCFHCLNTVHKHTPISQFTTIYKKLPKNTQQHWPHTGFKGLSGLKTKHAACQSTNIHTLHIKTSSDYTWPKCLKPADKHLLVFDFQYYTSSLYLRSAFQVLIILTKIYLIKCGCLFCNL